VWRTFDPDIQNLKLREATDKGRTPGAFHEAQKNVDMEGKAIACKTDDAHWHIMTLMTLMVVMVMMPPS
jgi:hypothetical protein